VARLGTAKFTYAASIITRELRLPSGITLLPHDQCGTVLVDQYGVAIHGQSFATRSITEDLSSNYPHKVPGLFNIGLLHTSLTGRFGHDNYAPTTVEALVAKGYDYWALGHVHAREVVCEDPWILFPGNLQGRKARESGAKGATLVTVRDHRVVSAQHRPVDVVRWCLVEVPVTGEPNLDGVMGRVARALSEEVKAAEDRPIAARVTFTGASSLHARLMGEAETIRHGIIDSPIRGWVRLDRISRNRYGHDRRPCSLVRPPRCNRAACRNIGRLDRRIGDGVAGGVPGAASQPYVGD
jgi:hypothetical protein